MYAKAFAGLAVLSLSLASLARSDDIESQILSLPVPVSTIYPGQSISEDQLMSRQFRTTAKSRSGIATDILQIIGKEARSRLVAGKPISLKVLRTALAIRKGDTTTASYEEDGFSISTSVVALQDGAAGDIIGARNLSTGTVVQARVMAGGRLLVLQQ